MRKCISPNFEKDQGAWERGYGTQTRTQIESPLRMRGTLIALQKHDRHTYMYTYIHTSLVPRLSSLFQCSCTLKNIGEPGDKATYSQGLFYSSLATIHAYSMSMHPRPLSLLCINICGYSMYVHDYNPGLPNLLHITILPILIQACL